MLRTTYFCLAVSVLGCLAHPVAAQTTIAAKNNPLGKLAMECKEKFAKESPRTEFVGKFSIFARRKSAEQLEKLFDPAEIISLAAPTVNRGFLGTLRGYSGCRYYVENGTLRFKDLVGANFFPKRYRLEPGEE